MNQLIPIRDNDGKKAVSARDLHQFLASKKDFSSWIKHRIEKYGLIENTDYVVFPQMGEPDNQVVPNPRPRIEYILSIDAAKELAMVEGNAKGKQARQYFIECERQLKENRPAIPREPEELLLQSVQLMIEQKKRLQLVEKRVDEIEAKSVSAAPQQFAVMGYAVLNKIPISLTMAAVIGRRALRICQQKGYMVDSIPDPRFGRAHTYPYAALEQAFNEVVMR